MKKAIWIWLAMVALFACTKNTPQSTHPYIITTTGMIGDLVRDIAGENYTVESLMGPGVDPHLFKASQSDIGKLSSADIIFYNGLHLEGKMTEILEKMGRSKKVVAIGAAIPDSLLIPIAGARAAYDPHIWFDVSLWRRAVPLIQQTLSEVFPSDREQFAENAVKVDRVLADLHHWVYNEVAQVPEEQRIMITAHDAFSYFGEAYAIKVHGLQGISTVAEYGVNDVNQMVDFILDHKIRAVFVETSVPRRSIEAVVVGVRSRGGEIKIGGSLYSDAMGGLESGADTYSGMVRANVTTIVKSLK